MEFLPECRGGQPFSLIHRQRTAVFGVDRKELDTSFGFAFRRVGDGPIAGTDPAPHGSGAQNSKELQWVAGQGRNGDSQMVAGGPHYPILSTNLIYHNTLYTLTYEWPGLTVHTCPKIPGFSLETLNSLLNSSRYVGQEVLQRNQLRYVDHWRVGIVFPQLPPGLWPRLPIALGDIYVDQRSRSTFWQLLQFGLQNLYDPQLDEWAQMD